MAANLIFNEVITASTVIGPVTIRTLADHVSGYCATLVVSEVSGTLPNFAVTINDTADGINWSQAGVFVPATTNAFELLQIVGPRHSYLRMDVTVTGTSPSARLQLFVE